MRKPNKSVPEFQSEGEERAFWESNDSVDHVDWSKARKVRLPNADADADADAGK